MFGIFLALTFPSSAEVQGEPETIKTVHAVVDRVGGRDVWANARSLYAKLKGYPSDSPSGGIEEVWTDFDRPDVHFTFRTSNRKTTRVTRADSGWTLRDDEFSELTRERARQFAEFWARSEYVLYHRMAKGDPTLRVVKASGDRLEFFDAESGEGIGWFQLNSENEVVKWRAPFAEDVVIEYVFGPFIDFGDIRMPKWGAQTNGNFRFENLDFKISQDPPPVSFDPPPASGK